MLTYMIKELVNDTCVFVNGLLHKPTVYVIEVELFNAYGTDTLYVKGYANAIRLFEKFKNAENVAMVTLSIMGAKLGDYLQSWENAD